MIYRKLLIKTASILCLGVLLGLTNASLQATDPQDTPTFCEQQDECAICLDGFSDSSTVSPVIYLDCGEKVMHHYHLGCVGSLLASKIHDCPVCNKPIKIFSSLVKAGDYERIHGCNRDLTPGEQADFKGLLENPRFRSVNPFPQPEKPTVPVQSASPKAPIEKSGTTQSMEQEDYLGTLTDKQQREFFDMPIAQEIFPPMTLSQDDINLNAELPKGLDPREWQVIIATKNGKRLRARRAVPLSSWPPLEIEESINGSRFSQYLMSLAKKLKGVPGDLALGFLGGLLIGPEFELKKELETPRDSGLYPEEWKKKQEEWQKTQEDKATKLSFRRLLYAPALFAGYALTTKLNPNRKIDSQVGLPWALGLVLGIGFNRFIRS